MKKVLISVAALCLFSSSAMARDDVVYFNIKDALSSPEAKKVLDPEIKISFGSGTKGNILLKGIMSNKKTNSFGKSDEKACTWALLGALKSFQKRAKKEGGTKVVNLIGYYKKNEFDSKTKFQCGAGNVVAGVTLIGDIAK